MNEMQDKPTHMSGPEWRGWEALFPPKPIEWLKYSSYLAVCVEGRVVATLEPRPHYCDRGHFIVKCYLPGLDGADGFPRYYMSRQAAVSETEAFLRWDVQTESPTCKNTTYTLVVLDQTGTTVLVQQSLQGDVLLQLPGHGASCGMADDIISIQELHLRLCCKMLERVR